MLARRATLHLKYNGTDISEDITTDLLSASWTDKAANEADELSVTLHDVEGKWRGDWLPGKGARLEASIEIKNWGSDGNGATLPCGTFEIDEIEVSGGSSGSKATIKAISSPVSSAARGEAKTKAWQDITLSSIAGEVASAAGLSLMYSLNDDPLYEREDQSQETDLNFLSNLVRDAGGQLKVTHDKMVIFDGAAAAEKEAVLTITPAMCESWRFKTKSNKVYKAAKVEYHDPELDEDIEVDVEAELSDLSGEDKNERVLVINQRVKSEAEAQRVAKSALDDANKAEVSGSFTSMGDVRLVAGVPIMMEGFGRFDGKYLIKSATHSIGSKYTVSVDLTRGSGKGGGGKTTKPMDKGDPQWKDYSAYGQELYR